MRRPGVATSNQPVDTGVRPGLVQPYPIKLEGIARLKPPIFLTGDEDGNFMAIDVQLQEAGVHAGIQARSHQFGLRHAVPPFLADRKLHRRLRRQRRLARGEPGRLRRERRTPGGWHSQALLSAAARPRPLSRAACS